MSNGRQDAWTAEEDRLLADLVLSHIREGSTQLKAFKEAGAKLARTAAACGFRWNSYVRKAYQEEIALAKEERKQVQKNNPSLQNNGDSRANQTPEDNHLSIRDVISYLNGLQQDQEANIQSYSALKEENQILRKKVEEFNEKLEEMQKEYGRLKTEYAKLLMIIDKARQMAAEQAGYEVKDV